jgi:predicted RNA-binding Zn ribbon-like protein
MISSVVPANPPRSVPAHCKVDAKACNVSSGTETLPNEMSHRAERTAVCSGRGVLRMAEFGGLQLVGGHPALDFMNTVEYRGEPEPGDRLDSFERLARWGVVAGLLSHDELTGVVVHSSARSSRAARALDSAIELRDALYVMVVAHIRKAPLPRGASRIVERQLRNASAASTLRHSDGSPPFSWHIPIRNAEDVAVRLADSANDLLLSLARVAVHQCSGPNCDWLFIDRSHGHRRLWCQPAKCGNIVRVRRFRAS